MSGGEAASALTEGNRLRVSGRAAEAAAAYRRAIALAPGFAAAHYNLGIALREAGDLRGSVLEFRKAARLDPSDMDAVQNVVSTLCLAVRRAERLFAPVEPPAPVPPMPMSVVVCSRGGEKLEAMQASFDKALEGREHEFVVIRDPASLAEGYQRAAALARHEIVVFSHDDVELASPRPFDALQRALERHDVVGLVGSRLVSGPAVLWAGHPYLFGRVGYPREGGWKASVYSLEAGVLGGMQALDGFLFAARRAVVIGVGFDAQTFDGFHFYDLDFTYRAHLAGLDIAVTTEALALHASEGRFGDDWRRYAARFLRKFPQLTAPQGRSFAFACEFATRGELARFHEELNALGATA